MTLKKILSLLVAMAMLFSCVGITAMAEDHPEKGYILTVYSEGDPFVIDAKKSASAFNLKTALEDAYVFINNPWMSGVSGTPSIVIDMYEDSQYAEPIELRYATTINGNGHTITYTGEGDACTGVEPVLNNVTFVCENSTSNAVAKIGDNAYATLDDALIAASDMTGDVTVEIYDKVTMNQSLAGSYDSIKFVGKDTDAELYMDVQGYITATGKNVAFENLMLSKATGGFIANAGFMNVAFGIYDVNTVSYTDCTFLNGAYASSGEVVFKKCTFYRSHDKYGLWAYGNVACTVDECTFADYRGIKMYAEGAAKTVNLTVKNSNFTALDSKPAIVLTYGESVTLENNTYSSTGVFELDKDGSPNGTPVTSDVAPICKNDDGACGVIVDGKIYTTVAQAAEAATSGSTVTLLHNSTETVELAEGVILDKNGFTADGVTVAEPPYAAMIDGVGYATVAEALDAAYNAGMKDVVITLTGDTNANTTDSIDIYSKYGARAFDNITIRQEDSSKPYYLQDLYTGWRTVADGKFIFDGVNIIVTSQMFAINKVELRNKSIIKHTSDSPDYVFYGEMYIESGSKYESLVDYVGSSETGTSLTVDGGKTDGTINSSADYKTVWLYIMPGNTMTIKNGAYAVVSNWEYAELEVNGTVDVQDARLDVFTAIKIGANGVFKVDKDSIINTPKITGTGKIVIDAADMSVGEVAALKNVNVSGFTGTVEVASNSGVEVEIVDGKITLIKKAVLVAEVNGVGYASLESAIAAANASDIVTVLADITQENGVIITDKNLTIDLAGYTFKVTSGANANNRAFKIDGSSVVTIKNGTIIACGEYGSGAYGTVRTEGTADVTLTDLKLYNYRGNGLNIKANSGTNVKISDTEVYSQYGGGIEAAGGNVVLDNVKVYQKGMYTAPYNSMAISVNGGGTVTVNSGYYESVPLAAEDGNNQGTSHGTWVAGVCNSGGKLVINGGTFVNGNYGDDNLATAPRGLILADTGAVIEVNGGTFNALDCIFDVQNNLGDATRQPGGTVKGGIFSAEPKDFRYGLIKVAEGYAALPKLDGGFVVGTAPTATVNNLGAMTIPAGEYYIYNGSLSTGNEDMPLNFVMQFVADQDAEDMETSPFAEWYADFVITFDGIENDSFDPTGCYLAGYYGSTESWDGMWVKIPVEGLLDSIDEGTRYPVMMGVGMAQTYDYICSGVQAFSCAMFIPEEILTANPDLKVNLELNVVDSSDDNKALVALQTGNNIYKASETVYTAEDFASYVAQIGDNKYATLADAIADANDGETIQLLWEEGDAPIAMNGAVFGKSIAITGDATVDWSKGFLFVGRGGEGDGAVTFDNANLKSASNSSSYGIHVSGREKNTTNKYDGTLIIKNSTIELDYLINKGAITLDNSTLTVKNGFSIGGRPASETENGEDATATLTLNNNSKVIVNNHNGMGLGYEAIGVMNIDATSAFETTQSFLVTAKGTMNIAGTAKIAGALTNNGVINLAAATATLISSECGNVASTVVGYDVVYAEGKYSVVETEKFEFYGSNILLGSSLEMNFYVEKSNLDGTDYYAEVKHYDENNNVSTTEIPYSSWIASGSNYLYINYNKLVARQMSDKIEVAIFKNDGTRVSVVREDGIRANALRILNNEKYKDNPDGILTTVVDMLNYGAAAQIYFEYNEENLANAGIDNYQIYATKEDAELEDIRLKDDNKCYGTNLSLRNNIVLTGYFKGITEGMHANVKFVDHNGNNYDYDIPYNEFVPNGSYHEVRVNQLAIADANVPVTITIYDGDEAYTTLIESMNSVLYKNKAADSSNEIYQKIANFASSAQKYLDAQ